MPQAQACGDRSGDGRLRGPRTRILVCLSPTDNTDLPVFRGVGGTTARNGRKQRVALMVDKVTTVARKPLGRRSAGRTMTDR